MSSRLFTGLKRHIASDIGQTGRLPQIECALAAFVLSALLLSGCSRPLCSVHGGFDLQPGDLLFQDLDCGELCEAIEKVTTGYNGANFTHVGIAAKDANDDIVVIEAVSAGVKSTKLSVFLQRSIDSAGRPRAVVGRLKAEYRYLIPPALQHAKDLLGRPYDKPFVIDNDAYYCSELIYEIFKRANENRPVFQLAPMTFKDPDTGHIFGAWQKYFDELGMAVPEGAAGINPGGISRSPAIDIIRLYGTIDGWENQKCGLHRPPCGIR